MTRLWGHVAFRLALSYGLLALGSICVVSAAFYFGTVGVLASSTDSNLISTSQRLTRHYESRGSEGLRQEIRQLLADGIEQDTEVYLLVAPDGQKIVGNISGWTTAMMPLDRLTDLKVVRDGRPSVSRLLPRPCWTVRSSWSAATCRIGARSSSSSGGRYWPAEQSRCCLQSAAL